MRVEFDFIVVGGGSAGAVIATRLTEDPDLDLLLLDCGPNDQAVVIVPFLPPQQILVYNMVNSLRSRYTPPKIKDLITLGTVIFSIFWCSGKSEFEINL